jgi:hypothetical protein
MLTIVLVFNLCVATTCFYVAIQLRSWGQAMAQTADALIEAERVTHEVLNGAPEGILGGQISTAEMRQSYRRLDAQLRQVQQVWGLISLGGRAWRTRPLVPTLRRVRP